MSDDELRSFLDEQMVMQCATVGPQGLPHMVPLWFVADGGDLIGWTYAKSQKARNLERDPRATIGIEDGVQYHELRGVMMECDVKLERDPDGRGAVRPGALRALRRRPRPGDPRKWWPPRRRSGSACASFPHVWSPGTIASSETCTEWKT